MTYAKDGYDESIRLSELSAHGSVNALGRITTVGTKASRKRQVHIENEMVSHDDTINAALRQIEDRLEKKSKKAYGPGHILVVVVDDCLPIRHPEDTRLLEKYAKAKARRLKLEFKEVIIVGESGSYVVTVHKKI